LGWVDNAFLPYFYNAVDMLVVPSRAEAQGIVILEAMSCGLPVVASNVGGIPQVLKQGVNGIMCTPGNVMEFTAAIEQLLSNEALKQMIASNGLAIVRSNYSWDVVARKLSAIYEQSLT
jgi:2-deoxystreptamine N-acetyl-D-glucosaminyltransferase/2-deoxystreptamine glucosyltransferase